jgi:uncharacterized protein (TIGR02444 family)
MAKPLMPDSDPGAEFWEFSFDFYVRPGAAAALLALQDRDGRDVNLMLFALWLGASGRGLLDPRGLAAAETAIAPLRRRIIEPLRELRRRLKGEIDADVQRLRDGVKALELAGEKAAQQRLAGLAPRAGAGGDPLADAAANLALCLAPSEPAPAAEAAVLAAVLADYLRERGSLRA